MRLNAFPSYTTTKLVNCALVFKCLTSELITLLIILGYLGGKDSETLCEHLPKRIHIWYICLEDSDQSISHER